MKNSPELERLNGLFEFTSSSCTAARVLMWVCGTAVAFMGSVVALAKSGFDAIALFRELSK